MILKRVGLLMINGTVSAITAFLMSGIGVWFNLYLTRKIGTAMMGHYQLMMSIYSFGVTFASSGANFATMRLVSENMGARLSEILRKCFLYALVFGFGSCVILLIFAPFFSHSILHQNNGVISLRIMALSLPFVAASGIMVGYFTAVRKVYKTALIQIGEQLLKIGLTVLFLSHFLPRGEEYTCLSLILAGTLGEGASFLASLGLFHYDRKKEKGIKKATGGLLRIALPIAFSSYLRSGLVTVKHLLVPSQLQKNGMTHRQAVSAFGIIHGIVLPIILFPTSLLFSFSNLLIPEVAEVRARSGNHSRRITYFIDRSIQLTLLFSFGTAGYLFFFAEELMSAWGNHENSAMYLKMLALLVPVMYLDHTVDNMLKGLDEQVQSMKYNIIDSAVGLGLLFLLLPQFGTAGYVFLICFSEILNFTLSFRRLSKVACFNLMFGKGIFLPALCAIIAVLIGKNMAFLLDLPAAFLLITSGIVTLLFYFLLLRITGCFTQEDSLWVKQIFQSTKKRVS